MKTWRVSSCSEHTVRIGKDDDEKICRCVDDAGYEKRRRLADTFRLRAFCHLPQVLGTSNEPNELIDFERGYSTCRLGYIERSYTKQTLLKWNNSEGHSSWNIQISQLLDCDISSCYWRKTYYISNPQEYIVFEKIQNKKKPVIP